MQDRLLDILINVSIVIGIGAVIALGIMIVIFIIVTALYIAPAKQHKYNLKELAHDRTEARIYLDEYKYIIENDKKRKALEEKSKQLNSLENKIRKKAAELKSINAEAEREQKKASRKKK